MMFDLILQLGEELIGILEALDCKDTPKAREILDTIDNVSAKYDQIQVRISTSLHVKWSDIDWQLIRYHKSS